MQYKRLVFVGHIVSLEIPGGVYQTTRLVMSCLGPLVATLDGTRLYMTCFSVSKCGRREIGSRWPHRWASNVSSRCLLAAL